jgi:hypothetical protein
MEVSITFANPDHAIHMLFVKGLKGHVGNDWRMVAQSGPGEETLTVFLPEQNQEVTFAICNNPQTKISDCPQHKTSLVQDITIDLR